MEAANKPVSESLKTSFVTDLAEDAVITSVFLVQSKDLRQKRDGDPYLALVLADRSGQIEAKMWDQVASIQNTFERDDFIRVRGIVKLYRDKPQLTIEKLRKVEDSEVSLSDFLPSTTADVEALWRDLNDRIAAMRNPHLRALLQAVFGDPLIAERFRRAPAAKVLHHACIGGLIEHVASLCRLADRVSGNYPFLDSDLLLTGILLHDLGKIEELEYRRSFQYTTPGQLLGHMVIVLEILHKKLASLPDFPRPLQTLVEHMIISHHGRYEFGSPKLPMFPEALMLHQLDDMDSKMQAMRTQLTQEQPTEAEWTMFNRSLERPLLRVEAWTRAATEGK